MGRWSVERLAAATGGAFVVLFIAAFFSVTASPPDHGDPSAKFVAYYTDHHTGGKISSILFGLALVALLWFLGSVARALRDAGEPRLAAVAHGSGVATVSVAAVIGAVQASLYYAVASDAPGAVKAFWDVLIVLETLIGFPVAALVGAVSVAAWRSRLFPVWFAALGGVAALVALVGGGALKAKGFYSPEGAYGLISLIVFLAWTLVTSVLLVMREGRTPEPATAVA
jgi:hypothetical protein